MPLATLASPVSPPGFAGERRRCLAAARCYWRFQRQLAGAAAS